MSSAAPFQEQILAWHGQGITATAIHQALVRKYRFTGSVHTIYRLLDRVVDSSPPATVILDFAVAEAAQVDFGQGPQIVDRATGEVMKTWFFVMTLAWSRHQYAELVRNQKVETWLACHRHAFEWFNGVPGRLIIDYVTGNIMQRIFSQAARGNSPLERRSGLGRLAKNRLD